MLKKIMSLYCFLFLSVFLNAQQLNYINPSNFNLDFSHYDQGTALFCAEVSNIVYETSDSIQVMIDSLNVMYPEHKLHHAFVEVKSDEALILSCATFMLISFRGTEVSKLRDWLTNSEIGLRKNKDKLNDRLANLPEGHEGFRKSAIRLMQEGELFQKMDSLMELSGSKQKGDIPVYLTGHSLGAAISQLYIECVSYKGFNFQGAYHFAPPLAVACSCRDAMRSKYGHLVYDIVNYHDYVPRAGRRVVGHFGKFYRICESGELNKEKEAYIRFRLFEGWKKEVKLHRIGSHIELLSQDINSSELVKKRVGKGLLYPCGVPKKIKKVCKR